MSAVNHLTVRFDSASYAVEAVKQAAYRFIDKFALEVRTGGDEITCHITFTPVVSESTAADLVAEFQKEVLDQDLRRTIGAETAVIRNTILALAFAPAQVKSSE